MVASDQRDTALLAAARARDTAVESDYDGLRGRVLEAAAACVARWGMTKTTVDDIARQAKCSRATVYRHFPEGKDAILAAVGVYEEGRFFADLDHKLARVDTLEDLLVTALSEATAFLQDNAVLSYLLEHEPEQILPHLTFDRIGPVLYRSGALLAPHLERFLRPDRVAELGEWATRIVLSYWMQPADGLDLRQPERARHLVTRYLLPGIEDDDLISSSA
jgi:AcrR family transcriptional regulator